MRSWKAKWNRSVYTLLLTSIAASGAAAQCRICDPFFHCIDSFPGAVVCIEGPVSCAMLLPCLPGGRVFDGDGSGGDLTTWTLFDAGALAPSPGASRHTATGGLTLGEEARTGLGGPSLGGVVADAALAHGRDYAIALVDAAGDGFALRRAVEGGRVRIEVRDVRGDVPGAVLASESLGERDQLRVPVSVEGRERVLVVQAASLPAGSVAPELSRLRRALLAAGHTLPPRQEPLLRARAL